MGLGQSSRVTLVVSLAPHLSHLACLAEEVLHLRFAGLETHVAHKDSLRIISGHSRSMAIALRALHPTTMQRLYLCHSSVTCCRGGGMGQSGCQGNIPNTVLVTCCRTRGETKAKISSGLRVRYMHWMVNWRQNMLSVNDMTWQPSSAACLHSSRYLRPKAPFYSTVLPVRNTDAAWDDAFEVGCHPQLLTARWLAAQPMHNPCTTYWHLGPHHWHDLRGKGHCKGSTPTVFLRSGESQAAGRG